MTAPLLILYGTDGCHLCDTMEDFLKAHEIAFHYVDIASNDALTEEFGWVIPVLKYGDHCLTAPHNYDTLLDQLNFKG